MFLRMSFCVLKKWRTDREGCWSGFWTDEPKLSHVLIEISVGKSLFHLNDDILLSFMLTISQLFETWYRDSLYSTGCSWRLKYRRHQYLVMLFISSWYLATCFDQPWSSSVLNWNKQDRQHTYKVTLRRVCESLLPWKSSKHYIFVCVCAVVRTCVCGGPGAWACACACV